MSCNNEYSRLIRTASGGWSAIFPGARGSETGIYGVATPMQGWLQGCRLKGGKNGISSDPHGEVCFHWLTRWDEEMMPSKTISMERLVSTAARIAFQPWKMAVVGYKNLCRPKFLGCWPLHGTGAWMSGYIAEMLNESAIALSLVATNDSITWSGAPFASVDLNAKFWELNVGMLIGLFWSFAGSCHATQRTTWNLSWLCLYTDKLRVRFVIPSRKSILYGSWDFVMYRRWCFHHYKISRPLWTVVLPKANQLPHFPRQI